MLVLDRLGTGMETDRGTGRETGKETGKGMGWGPEDRGIEDKEQKAGIGKGRC